MATLLTVTPMLPAGDDLSTALRLFTEELGFVLTWHSGTMAGVRRGRAEFNLVENTNTVWAQNASVSIGVDDLDDLHAEYSHCPAQVGALEEKSWGRREFHMILPTGVCLQFYQVDE
jgi:hypothetical protein